LGRQRIKLGLVVLIGLWLSVFFGMIALWQLDWIAGLLFVPYLAWVSTAGALNYSVMQLNPEVAKAG